VTRSWHLLTGEYPPDRGGVGDYTACLASALAGAGCDVHVWTRGTGGDDAMDGVRVHRIAGTFDRTGLRALEAGLARYGAPRTLLVQYAPQAFGRRGMNLAFCRWVRSRRAAEEVRVMFHEPFFPFGRQSVRRNALAVVTHAMAATLLRAAHRAYVSIPAWETLLRPLAPRRLDRMAWLPIPSTIPRVDDPAAVGALRSRIAGDGQPVVAHFGTYGALLRRDVATALRAVMDGAPDAVLLLLGDGGPAFADELAAGDASLRMRITAPGWLAPRDLSLHLQACDVAVQPYPDGASCRRTTLMACLANATATVTTRGRFTEAVWADAGVPLAPADDPRALAVQALRLLGDGDARRAAAAAGERLYDERFAIRHTVAALLDAAPSMEPAR
jgi:glycosyltransferase involved in cell wall biosynthesis